ncbi:hypothetical protein RJ55_03750 [Drechmeria coniospora]|nr:hypothetical protein RJ55_03750 [Drechmeria coniospora]
MSLDATLFNVSRPIQSLTALFVGWKAVLLAFALGAVIGPDYDTSTSLFFDRLYGNKTRVSPLAASLTRWDALYFVQHARQGYVFEQQWAFGAAMPGLVRALVSLIPSWMADGNGVALEPLVAIALAHLAHLTAVLALYRLTMILSAERKLAFVASALHIFSPAGIFLSAPYAESPFAGLTFIGNVLFALSIKNRSDPLARSVLIVGAGIVFGLATAFRSNGLGSGVLFAVSAVHGLAALARERTVANLMGLAAAGIGGLCVAAGSALPQFVAWKRYCDDALPELGPRPWCSRTIPSIYTFVQEEYWNVGFLHYWRTSHIPLFFVAAPMLAVLIKSGVDTMRDPLRCLRLVPFGGGTGEDYRVFVRTLAATQTAVALLAITNYHVQIINRMSSGYPVWYWWVARCLVDEKRQAWGRRIFVFIVMYAGIQGGLFASFLPPA